MSLEGHYTALSFRQNVTKALEKVHTILDRTRHPQFAADVPHKYDDKYLLAEALTSCGAGAVLNALVPIGLNDKHLDKMREWATDRSVTLRFKAEMKCEFLKEVERVVEDKTSHVVQYNTHSYKTKRTTKVIDYLWNYKLKYEVFAFQGNEPKKSILFQSHSSNIELTTSSKNEPYPKTALQPSQDVNITWLLNMIDDDHKMYQLACFQLLPPTPGYQLMRQQLQDRSRAEEYLQYAPHMDQVRVYSLTFTDWAKKLREFLVSKSNVQKIHGSKKSGLDYTSLNTESLFIPILPLFEEERSELIAVIQEPIPEIEGPKEPEPEEPKSPKSPKPKSPRSPKSPRKGKFSLKGLKKKKPSKSHPTPGPKSPRDEDAEHFHTGSSVSFSVELALPEGVLPKAFLMPFLDEQKRSIQEKFAELKKIFTENSAKGDLLRENDAQIVVMGIHLEDIALQWAKSMDYIEDMLRQQLIAAIGKVVGPKEFTEYMLYHNRLLFKEQYKPQPFSFAIRRPGYGPEGFLSILDWDGDAREPIQTARAVSLENPPMVFNLTASTRVELNGPRYIHGWMKHQFSSASSGTYKLCARARQFSSFILMMGRIIGPNKFDPSHAIIVSNKDEFVVPLLSETIPSAAEFSNSIGSLSPEQQRFAKAYRKMQLSTTLFGIALIQIKPQLELLLKLNPDSLTKEIKLSEDLQDMFINYHVPSDLVSYDGSPDAAKAHKDKLNRVKHHVSRMQAMIEKEKSKELTTAIQGTVYRTLADKQRNSNTRNRKAIFNTLSAQTKSGSKSSAKHSKTASHQQSETSSVDGNFFSIPGKLEENYVKYDKEGSLRPTILNLSTSWSKKVKKSLLSEESTSISGNNELLAEKQKAYDLLDALTKSGLLPIIQSEIHVVVAATHTFDKSLMDTIIQKNVNPIEKLERSSLIMSSVIHGVTPDQLLNSSQLERVTDQNPKLIENK